MVEIEKKCQALYVKT